MNKIDSANNLAIKAALEVNPSTKDDRMSFNELLADTYIDKGDYKLAEKHVTDLLKASEEFQLPAVQRLVSNKKAGYFYLLKGEYGKAHRHFDEALLHNRSEARTRYAADIQLGLFKVDSARNRLMEAIGHLQMNKLLSDSIFNEAKNRQVADLQVRYETEKKQQSIVLLEKENQAQKARISERELQRNALFGGAGMLLIVSGLLFNQYRQKARSNVELHTKQTVITEQNTRQQHLLEEKEWLLKEIHHRVKNNLQTIMGLLESQSMGLNDSALEAVKDSNYCRRWLRDT